MSLPTVDVIACEGRARRVLINQINADLSAKEPVATSRRRLRKASAARSYLPSGHSATFRRAFTSASKAALFFGQRGPNVRADYNSIRHRRSETDILAMNLLLLLAVAVPLSCLGLLALLALLAVLTLGGVIHVVGTVRGRRPQCPLGGQAASDR